MSDFISDRDELTCKLADYTVETMDREDLERYVYDALTDYYDGLTPEELNQYIDNLYGSQWFDKNKVKRLVVESITQGETPWDVPLVTLAHYTIR